jgi:hypothetical protein
MMADRRAPIDTTMSPISNVRLATPASGCRPRARSHTRIGTSRSLQATSTAVHLGQNAAGSVTPNLRASAGGTGASATSASRAIVANAETGGDQHAHRPSLR